MIERLEVVEDASGNTYSVEDDEDVGVGDGRKRRAEVKEHEERRITDGVIWVPGGEEVGKPGPGIESNRVVDALAPQNEAVLLVVCPVTDGGGNLAVDNCGYGLLSVFLRPSGRVLSAVRLTLVVVSSSAEPLGRKIPRLELKSSGGSVPHIMESWARFRVR